MFDRSRVQALLHDEVDGEVLHRRIEELLHDPRQAMDLVDEEHVLLVQIAQNAEEIPAALDRRARRRDQCRPHLVGDDAGERGLAQPGWAVEEHVVHALVAKLGGLDGDAQARHRLLLAHLLLERAGAEAPPGRARASFATLAWSCATMFFAFCWPMPGSARRYFSSWRAIAAATSATGAASARAATIGPTSFTVMSFSKNSLSRSDVNPIRTGRG